MNLINDKLKYAECPVNWDLTAIRKCAKVDRIVERLKERLEEDILGETYKTLNMMLFLSFEFYMAQKSPFEYLSYLRHSEEIIKADLWLRKYHRASEHVLNSMWAYSFLKGNPQRAEYYYKKIESYQEMTEEEKAFILAMKACFHMMYGPPGNAAALKIFSEVLVLDTNEPEWWFLKGKCLARMRRLHYRSRPTEEEIYLLEKAVEMEQNCSRYLIHFARSKADLSSLIKHNKTSIHDFKVIAALHADVESLLQKATNLRVDSAHLICHIAKSFMKLPHYFQVKNRALIQFCVLQALRKSPTDPMVNHTVGLYCLMKNDVESAVYFLTEASNMGIYGACFDLCRLKWRECGKYDPVPDLTEIMAKNDEHGCSEAHCLLATYYFFAKNDLLSAIDHWKKWKYSRVKESYLITSVFLGQESFDFNSALYDEVRLEYRSTRYSNSQDRIRLKEVLEIIEEDRPELQRKDPRRQRQYLIDKAQMVSKIGRAFPDNIIFVAKNWQKQKTKKQNKAKTQGKTDQHLKKGIYVSTKYNGYRRGKKIYENADDRKVKTRSQSANRAQEYDRKSCEKPFFRPPRRHHSVEFLNNDGNDEPGRNNSKNTASSKTNKNVGSGRILSGNSNLKQVKAASMESLLLVKSYKPKKRSQGNEQCNPSSSFNNRSSSQESLLSNRSTGREVLEPRTCGITQIHSVETESSVKEDNNRRYTGSRDIHDVRPMRQPSICEGAQTSTDSGVADMRRSWRQKEDGGTDLATPKSSFFKSWENRDQRDDSSSCTSSVSGESSWNKERSKDSRSSSRSWRDGGAPTAALFQPRNRWDQGDRLGPSSHIERGYTSRSFARPSYQGRDDAPTSSFHQPRDERDQGDRFQPSRSEQRNPFTTSHTRGCGDAPTSSYFQKWSHSGQGDRVKPPSRTSSAEENRWWNDRRPSGNSMLSSRSSAIRQEEFQPRSGGRGGYNPRGCSFSRGARDPRRDVSFREAGDASFDSLRRLELSKK